MSFLAASLLIHLPEEQAFCVLVKVMNDYGIRDLFKVRRSTPGLSLLFFKNCNEPVNYLVCSSNGSWTNHPVLSCSLTVFMCSFSLFIVLTHLNFPNGQHQTKCWGFKKERMCVPVEFWDFFLDNFGVLWIVLFLDL